MLQLNLPARSSRDEPVVMTGIGMITSVGSDRESSWAAVRSGTSGVRRLCGEAGFPEHLRLGAVVDSVPRLPKQLKLQDFKTKMRSGLFMICFMQHRVPGQDIRSRILLPGLWKLP